MPHLHINEKTGISLHKLLLSCEGEALTDSAALRGVNTTSKYLCHLNGFYFYLPIWFHGYWLVVSCVLQWQKLQLQGQTLKEFPQLPGCLRSLGLASLLGFGVGTSQKGLVKGWIYLEDLFGLHHHRVYVPLQPSALLPLKHAILSLNLWRMSHSAGGKSRHRGETTKKSNHVPFQMWIGS